MECTLVVLHTFHLCLKSQFSLVEDLVVSNQLLTTTIQCSLKQAEINIY
jgi:hypothetical protein